ncbi:MAG: hypothetical protein R2734_07815 [Nocardioides sp.]
MADSVTHTGPAQVGVATPGTPMPKSAPEAAEPPSSVTAESSDQPSDQPSDQSGGTQADQQAEGLADDQRLEPGVFGSATTGEAWKAMLIAARRERSPAPLTPEPDRKRQADPVRDLGRPQGRGRIDPSSWWPTVAG